MRVLYVCDYQSAYLVTARRIGRNLHAGGNQKVERICGALASTGVKVEILASGYPGNRSAKWLSALSDTLDGATPIRYVQTIDIPRLGPLVAAIAMKQWVKETGPWDAVLLYNLSSALLGTALYACSLYGIPLILEYEDDATISLAGPNRMHYWNGRRALSRVNRMIKGAIVVCPELARQLNTGNVLVLPGIVGKSEAPSVLLSRHAKRRRERPVLLYSGGLNWLKGPDLLISALRYLRIPVEVHIFGDGPLRAQLENEIKQIEGHIVRLHGFAERAVLDEALMEADICVNPHRMGRGHSGTLFPFKVLEYLSFGKPVVSSRQLEMPAGVSGAVVTYDNDAPEELGRALTSCIENLDSWHAAAQVAGDYARNHYSIEAIGPKITGIILHAIEGNQS
jgi:glycosyltransferase involved in cell wall biosynthesis